MVLYNHPFWVWYPSYSSIQRAQDSKVTNSDKTRLCLKSMLSWLNKMCWGCPVVPIPIAGDVIDLPFVWDSAKDLVIDFTWIGERWNVAFSIITSQLLTHCCSRGMQVFLWPQTHADYRHTAHTHTCSTWTHIFTAAGNYLWWDEKKRRWFSNIISLARQLTNGVSSLSGHLRCFSPFLSQCQTGHKPFCGIFQ